MSDSGKKKGIVTLSSLAKSDAASRSGQQQAPGSRGLYGSSMAQGAVYRALCSATRSGGAGTGDKLWKRVMAMGTDDEHGERYDALQGETEEKSWRRVEAENSEIEEKRRTRTAEDSDSEEDDLEREIEDFKRKYEVRIPVSVLTGKKQGQTLGGSSAGTSSLEEAKMKEKRLAHLSARIRTEKYGKGNPWLDEAPKSKEKDKVPESGVSLPGEVVPQDSGNLYD